MLTLKQVPRMSNKHPNFTTGKEQEEQKEKKNKLNPKQRKEESNDES